MKETVSEYKFKVREISDINKERICRENPDTEMIIVMPKDSCQATFCIHNEITQRKYGWTSDDVVGYELIKGFWVKDIDVDEIPKYVGIYRNTKERMKIEVTVRVFGEKQDGKKEVKDSVKEVSHCRHCDMQIYKHGSNTWYHSFGGQQCNINYINIPKAEPKD